MISRRQFVDGLGALFVTAAGPRAVHAQQPTMPVIGFLNGSSSVGLARRGAAFRERLAELDYVEGRNIAIEFAWAEGHYGRLPELAAGLVRRNIAVIAATGGVPSVRAGRALGLDVPPTLLALADEVIE